MPMCQSKNAVDGNRDRNYFNGHCMQTNMGIESLWWVVDLLSIYYIDHVEIWNRLDCCMYRFHQGIISVANNVTEWSRSGLSNTPPTWIQCANYTAPINSSGEATITLNCENYGRYVQVMSVNPIDQLMNLCEIEIYGSENSCGHLNIQHILYVYVLLTFMLLYEAGLFDRFLINLCDFI